MTEETQSTAQQTDAQPAPSTDQKPQEAKAAEETPEIRSLKAEALKAARELREVKAQLTAFQRREADLAKDREAREAAQRELDDLKAKDPRAWLSRAAGEPPEQFARRIAGDTKESQLERQILELRQSLAAQQQRFEEAQKTDRVSREEATSAAAYREVLKAAESSEEAALAAEELRRDPKAAQRWIMSWAGSEWPTVAREKGLDVNDPAACAREAAAEIDRMVLARWEKLRQNERASKRLGFGAVQSTEPPASQGTQPPRTITSAVAGSRSAAPATTASGDKPMTPAQRDRAARMAAISKLQELSTKPARTRG
jgi:hypothetical protein